ncbi:MAG: GNAT family N-acetyltransferase [Pyrinomonadaceae bacterium]
MNMNSNDDITIQHNEAGKRFETRVGGQLAFVEYQMSGKTTIAFTHTEVPQGFEGRGIGSKLVHAALEHARGRSLKVVPLCPFVAAYVQRHAEYQDLS